MSQEFDTEYTEDIVCPHCGHTFVDSWDHFTRKMDNSRKIDCGDCSKEFTCTQNTRVTYTTTKR